MSQDLVHKYLRGLRGEASGLTQSLKLRIQDCGGQDHFLQLLDMLITPDGTVHAIVFKVPPSPWNNPGAAEKERDVSPEWKATLVSVVAQLNAVQLSASEGAPIILVGTRKGAVNDDESTLRTLSEQLESELQTHCISAMAGLVRDNARRLCFFAVENSRNFEGDETIRDLVGAIEAAAHSLPSISKKVPFSWFRVLDEMRKLSERQERPIVAVRSQPTDPEGIESVYSIAEACGICGNAHSTFEDIVVAMLTLFRDLGALLWYPEVEPLEDIVILDPQWVIDAATCFARASYHKQEIDDKLYREGFQDQRKCIAVMVA